MTEKMVCNVAEQLKPLLVPIGSVSPDRRNARQHPEPNLQAIRRSLEAYGQRKPIVVNEGTMIIEAGNGLWQEARDLGWTHIAAVMVRDDPSTATGFAIMDNQSALLAEWDYPMLKDLLQELDTGAFDMNLTGFDGKAIEDLMTQFHVPKEGLIDDDEIPEEVEPICKYGDLWQLGNHRLLCGDATKKEDVERLMGGEKAELVLTDPPYNVGFRYTSTTNDKKTDDEYEHFCLAWFENIADVPAIIMTPGPHNEYLYRKPRDRGIWLKRNATAGASVFNLRCCEPILFYGDGFIKRPFDYFDYSTGFPGEMTAARCAAGVLGEYAPAKPMKLWVDLLNMHKADITVDLFLGNGTTLIACEKLNRRCYGMEIEPKYCDVIIARWENFTGRKAVKLND